MKMPTTTNEKAKKEPKAPGSVQFDDDNSELEFGDAGTQCVTFLEKKMRNLEKRKKKMELNREKILSGAKLPKEAELSLEQYDIVAQDLRFAGELHKQFLSINQKNEESVKKMAQKEIMRIEEILRLQFTLDQMGGDGVRQDFITGKHGAVVLTQSNLDQLDALYQAISPTREKKEKDDAYAKKLYTASDHLVNYLNGEESQVVGTTYKDLKDLISRINGCGYFEKVRPASPQEKPRDQAPASVKAEPKKKESKEKKTAQQSTVPAPESEPATTATTTVVKSEVEFSSPAVSSTPAVAPPAEEETKSQPLNTLEQQDAFFAPSSTSYSSQQPAGNSVSGPHGPGHHAAQADNKSSVTDIQSFTHNRPFQFIQTSYVMPDANSPTVVDPAVIAAQPAGGHGLQFISPLYDAAATAGIVTTSSIVQQQRQQQPPPQQQQHHQHHPSQQSVSAGTGSSMLSSQPTPQQPPAGVGVNSLGMPVDLSQAPVDLSQAGVKQAVTQATDYKVQSSFQQADSLFSSQTVGGHDNLSSAVAAHPSHSDSRTPALRESGYDIPPSIPMPPSQSQDPTQVEPQEKKSPMNANAPVFQSMYTQGVNKQVSMASPSVSVGGSDMQVPSAQADFGNSFVGGPSGDFVGGGDFQAGYQGSNGFPNGNYGRGPGGNRGGYRGSRGGGGSGPNSNAMNNRNGGSSSPLHNGFGPTRGSPPTSNSTSSSSRGARGGGVGGGFQNFGGPNPGYRPDSFAAGGYGSSSFGAGYQKRGGMNSMGPGNTGYSQRPNPMGGNINRGGGMRGGMPRGMPRGGGAPRGFSRQQ